MRPTTRGIGWCLIEESAQIGSFISLEMGKWDLKESKRKYFSKITYGNWAHLVFLRLWRAESKSNYHKPLLEKTTNDQWNGVTISRKILLFIGKKQTAQSARTKKALPLNEIKGHCKNEVLVNSDRIKYADQFLLTKLDEIVTGLWENQGFWRPTIAIYGAAYTSFIQFYLFCWKVRKNTANAMLSSKICWTKFNFVWLLKFKEFFEKFKWFWNYFQALTKMNVVLRSLLTSRK